MVVALRRDCPVLLGDLVVVWGMVVIVLYCGYVDWYLVVVVDELNDMLVVGVMRKLFRFVGWVLLLVLACCV